MNPQPILRVLGICAAVGGPIAAPSALAEAVTRVAAPDQEVAPELSRDLSPEATAFRAMLTAELSGVPGDERAAILGFYADRAFTPYWTRDGGAQANELIAILDAGAAQGLPVADYDGGGLATRFAPDAPAADLAGREVAATRAYLAIAEDLSGGVVRPASVDDEINIEAPARAPRALLQPLQDMPVDAALRGLEPVDPDYRALVAEKARLEALLGRDAWGPEVPDGSTLHPGESSPRVVLLRSRLGRLGYPAPAGDLPATAFDPGLKGALQDFQRDSGLVDDGVAGRRTLAALNAGVEERLRQVVVNLERMRWMNRDLGARHIAVNIPDYSVRMVDDGKQIYATRAVVGMATDTQTPEFSDVMTYMVVNPTWHIPDSIATRVYLPKLRNDPTVLDRSNMSLFTRSGVEINPRLVNFNQYSAGSFPFRIKQNPSSANALGRVKFMFPNQFSIYLHDTPSRELFAKDARAFSNGCVRLEDPLELAYILLGDQVSDPVGAFDGWLAAKSERHVNLARPVPVHILYRTVWAEPDGEVRYRADVYGRDGKVFDALADAGVRLPAAQG